jgi:hypothetical protein
MRKQFEIVSEQNKELSALAQEMATEACRHNQDKRFQGSK